jgi:hypothetical protein
MIVSRFVQTIREKCSLKPRMLDFNKEDAKKVTILSLPGKAGFLL